MAIRLITGRFQQWSNACKKQFYEKRREEGELACLCLVSALVIQPVLLCSVIWRFVRSATRSGNYHLFVYHMDYCQ